MAAPARRAAEEVGPAVTGSVERFFHLVAAEVVERGDVETLDGGDVHQVALDATGRAVRIENGGLRFPIVGKLRIVKREPPIGPVVDIPLSDRQVSDWIRGEKRRLLHVIP